MKKLYLPLLLVLEVFLIKAQSIDLTYSRILSYEKPTVTGSLDFTMRVVAMEDFTYLSIPTANLPTGWQVISVTSSKSSATIIKGDSVDFLFTISHSPILSFFPKSIEAKLSVQASSGAQTLTRLIVIEPTNVYTLAKGKVYFTPYNSAEVWGEGDFSQLRRTWIEPGGDLDTTRVFIAKSDIPVTDIMPTDSITEDWQDDLQLRFVQGLAYLVQMRGVDPAIIESQNIDDGYDSAYTGSDPPIDPTPQAAMSVLSRNFSGTISGRLFSTFANDLDRSTKLYLAGVMVKLKEDDQLFDQEFGEVKTDANGYFTINYSKNQTYLEGRRIELYLKFKSKNVTYEIKVKDSGFLGASFEVYRNLGSFGTEAVLNVGEIHLSTEPWRLLHWSVKAWEYFAASGYPLCMDGSILNDNALSVIPYKKESYFLPDGLLGASIPFIHPTIRIATGHGNKEGTIRHEFGHFVMWCLQGKNFIANTIFEHSWEEETNSRLAWTEGWADAVEMILDGVYWSEDQEFGFDESGSSSRMYDRRGNMTEINNGLMSEYYIATAIYDLWDGPSRGLPLSIPGSSRRMGFNELDAFGNLQSGWTHADNIELSMSILIEPMASGGLNGMVNSIYEYFNNLVDSQSGCSTKYLISDCFAQNRVVYDISLYELGHNTGMSADGIANEILNAYPPPPLIPFYVDNFFINPYFTNGSQNFNYFLPSNGLRSLTDDLILNGEGFSGTPSISLNPTAQNISNGTFSTCGTSVNISNASLVLGGSSASARLEISANSTMHFFPGANLTINNNSTLYIACGATLIFEPGASITLNGPNANIIIDGNLQIMSGATFNYPYTSTIPLMSGITPIPTSGSTFSVNLLNAPSYTWGIPIGWRINGNAVTSLTIQGASGSSVNIQPPTCGVSGTIAVSVSGCANPSASKSVAAIDCPNEALKFDGSNDFVNIPHKNSRLNLGTGPFVLEAFVKSTASGSIRALLSKRTFVNGSSSDGFLFGTWSDGRPFLQLAGAGNVLPPTGSANLYDGNCHHVAVRRSGTAVSFFVDGNLIGTSSSSRNISSNGPVRIAADPVTTSAYNGWVGEVRIWNVALSDNTILANIGAAITPQTGLMGHYDMNDVTGQILTDLSTPVTSTKNNGTLGSSSNSDSSDPLWLTPSQVTCRVQGNFREQSPMEDNQFEVDSVKVLKHLKDEYITVFPNPSSTEFYLKVNSNGTYNIKITTVTGAQIVILSSLNAGVEYPIGADLLPGLYFLTIDDELRRTIVKLIKK